MKTYEVIGIEQVDYMSKKTNRQVVGRRLHLVFDFDENLSNVDGTGCECIFTTRAESVKVGDQVEVVYNKYGGVEGVRVLNNKI